MARGNAPKKTRFPDARLTGVKAIFELIRTEPSWRPDPITTDTLKALGIARGKESNTLFALRFLGIIDDGGSPTKEFDSLRKDYGGTLERLIRSSYTLLFATIPVSRANQAALVRFFQTQGYSEETAEYQAKIFVTLCSDAGIDLPIAEATFTRARFRRRKKTRT
jgi:hypothetical protein